MQEQARVPAIRFAGFTYDWERRKLGEIVDVCSGRDYKHLSEGEIPVYGTGGYMLSVSEALSYDKDAIGIGRKGTIDKPYILKAPFWTVDTLFYAIPRENVDLDFIFDIFQNIDWKKKDESTGVPSLSKTAINDIDILVPVYEEQRVLGRLFSEIDHLITLHQRKYSRLCNVKKSMLEKMFPKDGASMPEIRFARFTDAWEQRKLGDYCDMYNGDRSSKYPNADDMVSDGIPFINAGDLENGTVNLMICNKISREKYNDLGGAKLQRGDIVYCLRGTLGKNAFIDNFDEGTVASSLVALRPKNINGKYLYFILNSNIEYRQRIVRDEGAAQPNLSAKSVSEYIIPAPSEEEQQQISACFSKLDTLITLHQRELERLQNIKKACLEKMFV
ncbi:restriction endonuclease subunit S [Clostridiaceae bacterium]|nr:restriction endonuclease subunit S [Clostridiaceae bacterium]